MCDWDLNQHLIDNGNSCQLFSWSDGLRKIFLPHSISWLIKKIIGNKSVIEIFIHCNPTIHPLVRCSDSWHSQLSKCKSLAGDLSICSLKLPLHLQIIFPVLPFGIHSFEIRAMQGANLIYNFDFHANFSNPFQFDFFLLTNSKGSMNRAQARSEESCQAVSLVPGLYI